MDSNSVLAACPACRRQYDMAGLVPGQHVRCACSALVAVPARTAHEARVLHCSACGGDLAEGDRSCRYCGSELTLAERGLGPPCPECFARLRPGAAFCSECGVAIRVEAARTARADANCPRCQGALVLHDFGASSAIPGARPAVSGPGVPEAPPLPDEAPAGGASAPAGPRIKVTPRSTGKIKVSPREDAATPAAKAAADAAARTLYTECASCGGIWLDATSFERLVAATDARALRLSVPSRTRVSAAAPETVQYIPCPVCANLMQRKNFAGCSGVIIDWCKGHGYWFDVHELEKVLAFVADGGLGRARKTEGEKPATRRLSSGAAGPIGPGVDAAPATGTGWLAGLAWVVASSFFDGDA